MKKDENQGKEKCHAKSMMSHETDESLKGDTQHVTLRQNTEKKKRGVKNGVGRHKRMNRGRGMQVREERSKGIEIRIADAFVIIKPTEPFKLAKHEV